MKYNVWQQHCYWIVCKIESRNEIRWIYMEASEPKWVNSIWNITGVNSLRLGAFFVYNRILYIDITMEIVMM